MPICSRLPVSSFYTTWLPPTIAPVDPPVVVELPVTEPVVEVVEPVVPVVVDVVESVVVPVVVDVEPEVVDVEVVVVPDVMADLVSSTFFSRVKIT